MDGKRTGSIGPEGCFQHEFFPSGHGPRRAFDPPHFGRFSCPLPGRPGAAGLDERRALEAFLLVFPSNLKPIVGQQATLTAGNGAVTASRVSLLRSQADRGHCDLVVKAVLDGEETGFLYLGANEYEVDRSGFGSIPGEVLTQATLLGVALTFTAAPPGSGRRMGVDRDEDGHLDGDERSAGTDPTDPSSHP